MVSVRTCAAVQQTASTAEKNRRRGGVPSGPAPLREAVGVRRTATVEEGPLTPSASRLLLSNCPAAVIYMHIFTY